MKVIRALLKPLSFIPALCLMYMIFSFSAQDGASSALSYKVSYKIVEVGAKVLGENLEPYQIDSLATRFHGIVRKIAHMTEYFALAVAVAFPLYVYGLRGIWLMLVAGFICVAFACGDEYHQSFVSGRSPSKRDVAIDSFGVFWGIILARIVGWTGRKTIFRPFSDEALQKRDEKKARKKQKKTAKRNPTPANQASGYPPYQGTQQVGYAQQQGKAYGSPQNNGYAPYSGTTYDNPDSYRSYSNNGYEVPQNHFPHQTSQNGYAPQSGDGYHEPQSGGYPYPNNPNGYTPYQTNGYDGPQPNEYPYQNQTGGYAPYPYNSPQQNGYTPYSEMDDDDDYVSDKLSEDMSFRKLMHDIKDQKQERHNTGKHPVHKAE